MNEVLRAAIEKLKSLRVPSTEELLTEPDYFGLTTASDVQKAVCRISDGIPLGDLATSQAVMDAVGDPSKLPACRPAQMHVLSAIRTGKSLWAGAKAVEMTQACDVSRLRKGEMPRVPIVSTSRDNSAVIFGHILAGVTNSTALSAKLIGSPKEDSLILRHPSGIPVEICVTSGARAGSTLTSRWMAGCIFDEATRMVGREDGVVNYDDARAAVAGRILPGGQILTIGSPWAPYGPVYDDFIKFWKHPSIRVVVVKSPGWDMNPFIWTPEACAALKASSEDVWVTDCAAEFSSPMESMFTADELKACTREGPAELPPMAGLDYKAEMDPATRGNSWTFVVSANIDGKTRQVMARQWTGTKSSPLNPSVPIQEMAEVCREYKIRGVTTDQWMGDAIAELARRAGLTVWVRPWSEASKAAAYKGFKEKIALGQIELCPEAYVRADLQRVKRKPVPSGFRVLLPKTSDGRHCDFAPPTVGSMCRLMTEAPDVVHKTEAELQVEAMLKAAKQKWGQRRKTRFSA